MVVKKNRTLKVNFEGVEAFTLVPEDDYEVKIDEVTKEEGSDSGEPYLAWTFEIVTGKSKGKKLFYNTSLQSQALWNLRGLLEAFGLDVPDEVMELDLDELESHDGTAGATVEHETYQGKPRARVVDVHPVGDNASGGKGSGKEDTAEVEREDIMAMDEDELKSLIDDNDLGVDLDDYATLKKKREAVADAAEEKTGDEDKGEAPDVSEMDEDDLTEVIKDNDLDVDLDKYGTLKKKRAAVAEALEEAGDGGKSDGDDEKVTEDAINDMGKDELKAFVKKHKLDVELEGTTSKQRRAVLKAAKAEDLIEE